MTRVPDSPLVVAIDGGSPINSVALARGDRVLAAAAVEAFPGPSSESLLALLDQVVRSAGVAPSDLGALAVLRGPGSFTGLRIGLATALALHQALGLPAAVMPTLEVLAASAPVGAGRVIAAVDAMRDEWFVQTFTAGASEGPPALVASETVGTLGPGTVIAFGSARLATRAAAGQQVIEASPLAPTAARLAAGWREWDQTLLTAPLYLRPAPTTPPTPRRPPAGPLEGS